jgi:hypothetical protein
MNVRFAMGIVVVTLGCQAGDLSDALSSGHCDGQYRCGAGFECNRRTRECVPLGTLEGDAGAGGSASPAGAAGAAAVGGAGASPSQDGGQSPGLGSAGAPGGGQTGGVGGGGGQGCSGATLCDGACVDTTSDPDHCGSCGRVCSSQGTSEAPRCIAGSCIARCSSGLADCGPAGSQTDDGCETDLTTNDMHCGSCANTCVGRTSKLECDEGYCGCTVDTSCGSGGSASCGSDGICTCAGTACRRGETCIVRGKTPPLCACDGARTCGPNQTCCIGSGQCVDLATSTEHCGACGRSCPVQFECLSGACLCVDDHGCDAGGAGVCTDGVCKCGGVVCQEGERCLVDGRCG